MTPAPCHRAGTVSWVRVWLALLAVLLVGAGILPAAAQSASSPVFNPANGHWYQVVQATTPITWHEARATAESLSFAGYRGHLATITSVEENQFIWNNVIGAGQGRFDYWLGGYQDKTAPDFREPGGGWRWVTGEPFTFTYWAPGEPNHGGSGSEDVLEYWKAQGDRWNDVNPAARQGPYLVEYKPSPPPPVVAAVQLFPRAVVGGTTATGQVALAAPAGPGGAVLTCFSSNPAVAVPPATLIVPAGATAASFPVVTFPVAVPTTVVISVSAFGVGLTAALQVLPTGLPFPPGNLLINGSFEEPRVPAGHDVRTPQGTNELLGWRITRGTVDLVASYSWQAAPGEGAQSLDLVGDASGTIEQIFATVPGQEYLFSGWLAHNISNPIAPEGRADVFLNGLFFVQLFHRDPRATTVDMRWVRFTYRFRAAAYTTTLTLAEVSNLWTLGGLVLDGLAVTPAGEPFPPPPPGVPTGLAVRLISPAQIELAWLDNSVDETGFEIQRRIGASEWVWIARVAANTTRFGDYSVSPGTTYTYRVRAESAAGVSAWSNEASATTLAP